MRPVITDADTGHILWLQADCAAHCGVTTSTFRSYNRTGSKMNVPTPVAHLDGRTPLWDAEEIKAWHARRPGSPVPGAPTPRRRR